MNYSFAVPYQLGQRISDQRCPRFSLRHTTGAASPYAPSPARMLPASIFFDESLLWRDRPIHGLLNP
jgi:hypothetical protein